MLTEGIIVIIKIAIVLAITFGLTFVFTFVTSAIFKEINNSTKISNDVFDSIYLWSFFAAIIILKIIIPKIKFLKIEKD